MGTSLSSICNGGTYWRLTGGRTYKGHIEVCFQITDVQGTYRWRWWCTYKEAYKVFGTRCVFYSSHRADSFRLCATRPVKMGLRQHTPSLPCVRPYESLAIVPANLVGLLVLVLVQTYMSLVLVLVKIKASIRVITTLSLTSSVISFCYIVLPKRTFPPIKEQGL